LFISVVVDRWAAVKEVGLFSGLVERIKKSRGIPAAGPIPWPHSKLNFIKSCHPPTIMKTLLLNTLIAAASISSVGAHAQTTYQRIGNTTFSSDGRTYNHIGNTTMGSDGSSYNRIGSTTYSNDGRNYNQIGNTTFGSDGTTANRIGNSTFINGPSGSRTCNTIGSTTFCQ
jgi:hypothetical protein